LQEPEIEIRLTPDKTLTVRDGAVVVARAI
jgi:hypothetical protein